MVWFSVGSFFPFDENWSGNKDVYLTAIFILLILPCPNFWDDQMLFSDKTWCNFTERKEFGWMGDCFGEQSKSTTEIFWKGLRLLIFLNINSSSYLLIWILITPSLTRLTWAFASHSFCCDFISQVYTKKLHIAHNYWLIYNFGI